MKNRQRTASDKASAGLSAEERAAARERVKETKAGALDGEAAVREKIAEMTESDRGMAERLHALIKASAPELSPTTWYGQPAYAKDGKVICFFQPAQKFKTRYATLGFSDRAKLDEGGMWATYFALTQLTAAEEKRIRELLKRAVS